MCLDGGGGETEGVHGRATKKTGRSDSAVVVTVTVL